MFMNNAMEFLNLAASSPKQLLAPPAAAKEQKPGINGDLVTFLNYVFVEIHGGHQAGALSVSRYRGHREAMKKAEAAGAVKVIASTKYGVKPKQFWVLTDEGKAALAKFRRF
jgi:hypothetical protein